MKTLTLLAAMCLTLSASADIHRFIADEILKECKADVHTDEKGNINIIRATVPSGYTDNIIQQKVNRVFNTQFEIFEKYSEMIGQEINIKDSRRAWRKGEGIQMLADIDGRVMLVGYIRETNELIIIY